MAERREYPRFESVGVTTPWGEVVDVSAGGLKVFCKRRPEVAVGEEVTLAVAFDGQIREVSGVVQRIDPLGPRAVELGVLLKDAPAELLLWLGGGTGETGHVTTGPRVWRAA